MHDKFRDYRRNLVPEYLVWRVQDRVIDWFELVDGEYQLLKPDENRIIRSKVFPGLWLNTTTALDNDAAAVLATLKRNAVKHFS